MRLVEEINMKCTREQYDSIESLVGKLTLPSTSDFDEYNYLTNHMDGTVFMYKRDLSINSYERFDKTIFLKACGIETKEIQLNAIETELTREEIEIILGYKIKIVK